MTSYIQLIRVQLKTSIVLFCSLYFVTLSEAMSYYVSTTGDDTNSGTITQPFQTISKAAAVMNSEDECIIFGGTYRERVVVEDDNVTFRRYKNDEVIISGADPVTDWSHHEGDIYKAPFSWTGNKYTQVFYNGSMQQMARYPDNITGNMLDPKLESGYMPCETFNETSGYRKVTFPDMNSVPDNHWAGGIYRGISGRIRSNTFGTIVSSTGKDLECDAISKEWADDERNAEWFMGGESRGYIFHLNALTRDGEWWHENGYLYFQQPGGGAPSDTSVEAQTRQEVVLIQNRTGVTFSGITVKAGVLTLDSSNTCRFENCSFEYIHPFYEAVNYNSSYSSVGGIYFKNSDHNTVDSCYFAGSWGHLLYMEGGTGNKITNSVFKDNGWYSTFSSSIHINGSANTLIEYCTFGSTGRFHVRMDTNAKTTIRYCDFSGCLNLGQDAGSIQSVGMDLKESEFAYNTLHDSTATPVWNTGSNKQFVVAFYIEDTSNYTAHHNLVWNYNNDGEEVDLPEGSFCYLGPRESQKSGIRYYNNLAWNCDSRIRIWNRNGLGGITAFWRNNIFDSTLTDVFGTPSLESGFTFENNASLDPASASNLFNNAAAGDFSLKAGNKAIDTGMEISGITDNFAGAAPDAGPIEAGQFMWRTGASITGNPLQQPFNGIAHSIPGVINTKDYDEGGIGLAYHDLTAGNDGNDYRNDDVDLATTSTGVAVGSTVGGEWLEYTVNAAPGYYTLKLKASAADENRTIRIQLDGEDLVNVPIPNTGSLDTYTVIESTVVIASASTGQLRVCFDTGGTHLESMEFVSTVTPETLELSQFNPRLTSVFGTPYEGTISYRTDGPNNSELLGTATASPWKADFKWEGLNLDGSGGTDDVIYFTLSLEASTDQFNSLTDIQAKNTGIGVINNQLDVGEELRITIEDVSLSNNTTGIITFNGFSGAQLIKLNAEAANTSAIGLINGETVTFIADDGTYKSRGVNFSATNEIIFGVEAQTGISLAARNMDLQFAYLADPSAVSDHILTLEEGYQIVSFDFVPATANVQSLFTPILDYIEFIEAGNRSKLYKSNGTWSNQILDWNSTQAYLIKAKPGVPSLTIVKSDQQLPPTINLETGINIVPTYTNSSSDLQTLFNSILESNIVWVKDIHGNYLRKVNSQWIDTIKETTAGAGLIIKVNGPCSLPTTQ